MWSQPHLHMSPRLRTLLTEPWRYSTDDYCFRLVPKCSELVQQAGPCTHARSAMCYLQSVSQDADYLRAPFLVQDAQRCHRWIVSATLMGGMMPCCHNSRVHPSYGNVNNVAALSHYLFVDRQFRQPDRVLMHLVIEMSFCHLLVEGKVEAPVDNVSSSILGLVSTLANAITLTEVKPQLQQVDALFISNLKY